MSDRSLKTFKGGVHPPEFKELSSDQAITKAPVPEKVSIPLRQNIGAPNSAVVSPGDRVEPGQLIGKADAFVSAPVHSSVQGVVEEIKEIRTFSGENVSAVIIKADPEQPEFQGSAAKPLDQLDADDIRAIARDAGLVGMGGAAFPTHVKLTPPKDRTIDYAIINACECEPFLTCDHRLMLERPDDLISGLKLLMKVVGANKGCIGIENNKMDAAELLAGKLKDEDNIEVSVLQVKYPEGSEKQLIYAATGREVPPGKLPFEVGCLVQNVGTAVALFEAASTGKPLYERVLTVTGQCVGKPANLLARVGTPISTLVEACGGLVGDPARLVMGGPMTGWAQPDLESVVVKGTSGVVALPGELAYFAEEHECVRCTKCVDACPMFLMPNFIVEAVKDEDWEKAEMWGAVDCFECGSCTYTCPAYIPHVKYVREAKAQIAALKSSR